MKVASEGIRWIGGLISEAEAANLEKKVVYLHKSIALRRDCSRTWITLRMSCTEESEGFPFRVHRRSLY